jgi:hypothetical protein
MKKINGASHQEKDLSIKTVAVEIKVMTVDGKRMTKAVFDQIPQGDPFDERFELKRGVKVLGYVLKKTNWSSTPDEVIVFSESGQLKKHNACNLFSSYKEAADAGFFSSHPLALDDMIPAIQSLSWKKPAIRCLSYACDKKVSNHDQSVIDECSRLISRVYAFIESIKDEQIYISI